MDDPQPHATPDDSDPRPGESATPPAPRQTVRAEDWLLRGYDGREDGGSVPPPPGAGGQLPPPIGLTVPPANTADTSAHRAPGPVPPPQTPASAPLPSPTPAGAPHGYPPSPGYPPPAAAAPALRTQTIGPTWQMVVAALIAIIYGVWYAIEGLMLAISEDRVAEMYQQVRQTAPDVSFSPEQLSLGILLVFGALGLLYAIGARFLLQFSNAARMLLIVLGWVNISLFIRIVFIDGGSVGAVADNLLVGIALVMLLASPDVRRRIRSKGVAVLRGPDPGTATAGTGQAFTAPQATASPFGGGPAPYPLRLSVHMDARPWGGTGLRRLGKPVPDGTRIGESWEVSGHPHAESRIENGPLAGRRLNEVLLAWGEWMLGPGRKPTAVRVGDRWEWRFPLLAKFLDTTAPLSVQVHPDNTDDGPGKFEAWVILHAGPDAHIYQGFAADVTTSEVRDAIAAGRLPDLLRKLPVHDGDVILNPPGVVHAIGPNVRLYEIQQVCDLTWRLYDFDRTDRELHVEQALGVIRLQAGVPDPPPRDQLPRPRLGISGGEADELIRSPHFGCWRVVLPVSATADNTSCRLGGDVVALVHHVAGSPVHVAFTHHGPEYLKLGETLVIPAAVLADGVRFTPQDAAAGATTLLVSTL